MYLFILHCFYFQPFQFHVKHLAQVHHNAFMYFLPKVCPEYLDEWYFESGKFAMHENACEVQLHLEPNIHIGPVDCWWPPESEPSVRDLVESWPLGMSEFLVFHTFLKATSLFPEESLPGGEVGAFE